MRAQQRLDGWEQCDGESEPQSEAEESEAREGQAKSRIFCTADLALLLVTITLAWRTASPTAIQAENPLRPS